jgi:hypothetical protein
VHYVSTLTGVLIAIFERQFRQSDIQPYQAANKQRFTLIANYDVSRLRLIRAGACTNERDGSTW